MGEKGKRAVRSVCGIALSTAMVGTAAVHAQEGTRRGAVLEEVVVTAQRREQLMQDVPVSLEAFSGEELHKQGLRTMDDLADLSPSVEIDIRTQDQDISIRGIGTTGNNLTLEQAAPTFVDGVHFGRTSMIQSAFLDLDRVEVLRGPQPVYFGQNATAGAFSLTTRKPTPTWEGDLHGEAGNFGRYTLEGGIGGPINETLGIRVAGKWDTVDGFMEDIVSGDPFPARTDKAGRMILEWAPTSDFNATFQISGASVEAGADGSAYCLTGGEPEPYQYAWAIPGVSEIADDIDFTPLDDDCFSDKGISNEGPFLAPPTDLTQEDADAGILDIRNMARQVKDNLKAEDQTDSMFTYLELNYLLDSGIELSSLTGYIDYDRSYFRDNGGAPFVTNLQNRTEDSQSFSQEFRVASVLGSTWEWMVGAYYKQEDLSLVSDTIRANIRRPRRYNDAWQDSEWLSGFASVTYNFMNDKASIDVGGRYSQVKKTAFIQGYGATWIFDVDPTAGLPGAGCIDGVTTEVCFEDNEDVIPLGGGRWTHGWRTDVIADVWDGVAPVGITDMDPTIRRTPGPYRASLKEDHFDPQVVFRYRPTDDVSLYAKWAQAFKAGGFDTGASSLADDLDAFQFDPEYAENYEVGARATFWNGRARGGITLFETTVEDLQIATTDLESGSVSTNAGEQRTRGIEFDLAMVVTDQLALTVSGALMDGEMVEYQGAGCTDAEERADLCITEEESIELVGDDSLEGTIDRSGEPAPRTPDWKITVGVDYEVPLMDRYLGTFNGTFDFSDGYIDDVEDFSKITMWDEHTDVNVSIGFGDINGQWEVAVFGRNLLEARPEYFPGYDVSADGFESKNLSIGDFRTYGLQFTYNYH